MPEEKVRKLVNVYLRGKEQSSMWSYESSFMSLRKLCEESGLSVFRLDEEVRCQLWLQAGEKKLTSASEKGISS